MHWPSGFAADGTEKEDFFVESSMKLSSLEK
jgi:hypothetical protein